MDTPITVALISVTGTVVLAILNYWLQQRVQKQGERIQQTKEEVKQQGEQLAEQLVKQQEQINELVKTSTSASVFEHLAGIAILKYYEYRETEELGKLFRREFYHLKLCGFIGPHTLEFDERLNGKNIAKLAEPTPTGKIYIKLRKDLIPKDWLTDPDKRENLRTDALQDLGLRLSDNGTLEEVS